MKTKLIALFVVLTVALFTSACGGSATPTGPATSALTDAQAREIASNMLANGYNNLDFDAYTRDFNDQMRSITSKDAFGSTVQQYMGKYGRFVSIDKAELTPAKTKGYVRWTFTSQLENGTIYLQLVFPQDGTQIAGAQIVENLP